MSTPGTLESRSVSWATLATAALVTYLVANPHLGASAAECCVRVVLVLPILFGEATGPCAARLVVRGGTLIAKGLFSDAVVPVRDIAGVLVTASHLWGPFERTRRIRIFTKDGRTMVEAEASKVNVGRFLSELAAEARAVGVTGGHPLVRPRSGFVADAVAVLIGVAIPCLLDRLVVAGVAVAATLLTLWLATSWASLTASAAEATDDLPDDPGADTGLAPWKRALARS